MDDPVHGRYAAIYAIEKKRLPSSFFLGLGIAVALHVGLAYYLLQHTFAKGGVIVEEIPRPVDPIPIDIVRPDKPQETLKKPPIVIHDPAPTPIKAPDTIPVAPAKPNTAAGEGVVIDLPTTPAGPTEGTAESASPYVTARWSRFPDADALTSYYPPRAMDDEVEGIATVQCTVLDTAGRVSCVVISEKPGGYGFGAATVRMVQDKGRVDTTKGNVQVGSMLRLPVKWTLN